MTLKLVPTVRTDCSNVDLCKSFILVWKTLFNAIPSKQTIAVIVGQHNLETGSGNACWNWNLANIKAKDSPNEEIEYCVLNGVWEMVNGQKVILQPTDPGSWFRSFSTLELGIQFYLNFLTSKRYRLAWPAVVAGNPEQFCVLLRQQGYYTASVEDYSKAVRAYYNRFMKDNSYEIAMSELNSLGFGGGDTNGGGATLVTPEPITPETVTPVQPVTDVTIPDHNPVLDVNDSPLTLTPWQQIQNIFFNLFKKS